LWSLPWPHCRPESGVNSLYTETWRGLPLPVVVPGEVIAGNKQGRTFGERPQQGLTNLLIRLLMTMLMSRENHQLLMILSSLR